MRNKKKQLEWIKKHYRNIVGLRPIKEVKVQTERDGMVTLTPNAFLFRKRGEETYQILHGLEDFRVHFPRSLGRRVRITINEVGIIVGETDKCFAKQHDKT